MAMATRRRRAGWTASRSCSTRGRTPSPASRRSDLPGGRSRDRPDGSPMFAPPHRGLSAERVRYVGDPVALVVAETLAQAEDAAERVQVDYEPLPSVTSTAKAVGGAPVWDECPDNISNLFEAGDKTATEAAFVAA